MRGIRGIKDNKIIMRYSRRKGSMTVEACIVLPLFLCIIISVICLIRLTYTHELIQHALNETAQEMASTAYIFQASGLLELHDTARDGINNSSDDVKELLKTLKAFGGDNVLPIDTFEQTVDSIASGGFNGLKTELLTPVSRHIMEKYIAAGNGCSADERLNALNIKGGLDGLDLSSSEYIKDEDGDIELVVRYDVCLPVPVKIFPDIRIVQRATAKAWLSGDEPAAAGGSESETDDIWSLGNLERGKKIRNLFGANLPFNFPVIARFDNGEAVMIKSMDLTADSYKTNAGISKVLDEYIFELDKFKGQESPYGSRKIVIKGSEIKTKQLLLVIPENELKLGVGNLIDSYVSAAGRKGIDLKIKRYGVKKLQQKDEKQ